MARGAPARRCPARTMPCAKRGRSSSPRQIGRGEGDGQSRLAIPLRPLRAIWLVEHQPGDVRRERCRARSVDEAAHRVRSDVVKGMDKVGSPSRSAHFVRYGSWSTSQAMSGANDAVREAWTKQLTASDRTW